LSTLKIVAQSISIDFDRASEEDLRAYVGSIERSALSDWTKHDYKVSMKKFYKWLNGGEEPVKVRWIKTTLKKHDRKLPEDMLKEEDVERMIDAALNKRDKAIIALLWDIGARIGEIGNLRVKDIKFDDIGISILVNGKTGPRRVRAVWSVNYLKDWLKDHPNQKNPEAPLWFNFAKKTEKLEAMQYGAIRMQLNKISKKAGISKKIHPHLFRHSRCTHMASYLTEAQMNVYFGWVQGSDMPSIYVHLSGRDVDDAILKANGVVDKDAKTANVNNVTESPKINLSSIIEAKVNKFSTSLIFISAQTRPLDTLI
jgi:integrase/recombinase XerD